MNTRRQQPGPADRRKAMLLLTCLALLAAGCGREAAAPEPGVADATAAAEPRTADGTATERPTPEAAPETTSDAEGSPGERLAERERGLTRQMLALMKRRDEIVRDQIAADSETRTLHEQMIRSRDAYQKHVAALPEVANLEQQLRLLSKQQQATHDLANKLNEEKQP